MNKSKISERYNKNLSFDLKLFVIILSLTIVNAIAGEIIVYDPVGGTTTLGIAPKSIMSTGGGFIPNTIAPRSSISNNNVTVISTGSETVNNVIGGFSDDKNVERNTVNISGGTINIYVLGGYSNSHSVTHNTVNISGGAINSWIYGGYSNSSSATNNTVNILGNPKFRANIILYGGNKGSGTGDTFTGNTINIASKGLFVSNIANFEFINFYLSKNIAPNDTVFTLTNRPNFSVSKLGVALANDNTSLNVGDRINLVKSNAGVIAPNDLSNHINDPKNILKLFTTSTTFSNIYSFDILSDTTSIYTVVKNKENNPQQKSILEAGASMTGMLNIASDSIDSVLAKGLEDSSTDSLPSVFASANGYDTRLKSGSHVDIKGVSTIVGVSKKINENYTHGMFIELGYGNYDSFNSFNNGDIHGKGDNKYYGFGYLGKLDNLAFDTYVEGSARVGKIKSNYKGYGFTTTELPQYDSNRIYYSTHLGGGKIIDINNISNLDIYAKAYYTRLNSDEIDVVGTKFKLNSSDSLRAKLGARYNYDINDNLIFYTGAAYEREFKGEAKGKNLTFGYELDAPSLKGNSSIAEIGVRYTKPDSKKERFSIDLSTQGSLGQRKGVSGTLSAKYEF